jgi:hypothetical protein
MDTPMTEYLIVAMNVASGLWMLYLLFIGIVLVSDEKLRLRVQIFGLKWWIPACTVFALIWLITYNLVG